MGRPAPLADDLLTKEQQTQVLDALSQGIPNAVAARAVGLTGTQLRNLRGRDPVFGPLCQDAQDAGVDHYQDRLRAAARVRALAPDGHPRILEMELATRVPEYAHLRRDKLTIDGRVEHAIILDPARLEELPTERLVLLRDLLAEVGGEVIEAGEIRELPSAS